MSTKKKVIIKDIIDECKGEGAYEDDFEAVIPGKEYDLMLDGNMEDYFIDEKGRNHYLEIYEYEIKQVTK